MTDTQLRRGLAGRTVRPYAFAVSLATLVIAYATVANVAVGDLLDGPPGDIIGAAAIATVAALWWGWWARSDRWMIRGLLWSTGVWTGVGVVLSAEGGAWVSALLAWCWVIASGGAWLLEKDDMRGTSGR